MEVRCAMDRLTMDRRLTTYPHIPRLTLTDLHTIGANPEQYIVCDAVCKRQADRRLHAHTLEEAGPWPGGAGTGGAGPGPRITVAVVGARCAGKSATGNTLLEERCFHEGAGTDSQTVEETSRVSATDSLLTVIDTPGSWTLAEDNKGRHVDLYVLVINLASSRLSKKELNTIRNLEDYNNILASRRCLLLLTHASDVLRDKSLSDYLSEVAGDPLHELIYTYMDTHRVLAIDNPVSSPYESRLQRRTISRLMSTTFEGALFQPSGSLTGIYLVVGGTVVLVAGYMVYLAAYYSSLD